ncbi:MAG: hypothetical protein AB7W16_14910 [Candidatus Obscuribacterales bacterium]
MNNAKKVTNNRKDQQMNNAKVRKNGNREINDLEKPIELNEKSLDSAIGGQDQWKQAAKVISEMP